MNTNNIAKETSERIAQFIDRLVDGRDPDLATHHRRGQAFSVTLCRSIGCESAELEVMAIASSVHDLGKMSINEHILNKPARLTASEFDLVKQHTIIGERLIAPLNLDHRIQEVIVSHHENCDGSGYPKGLKREDIPFLARVMRIADSYDALTSDRPYHKGISSEEAVSILSKVEHFFDPYIFKAFVQEVQSAAP